MRWRAIDVLMFPLYIYIILFWLRCISWRRVVARTIFVRATCRWNIATWQLTKTRSVLWLCKCVIWVSFFFYMASLPYGGTQAHNFFCLSEGRKVCRCSRSATRRPSPWRSLWPIKKEMMHMKPLWSPPSHPPLPTLLPALCLMWVSIPSLTYTYCTHAYQFAALIGT